MYEKELQQVFGKIVDSDTTLWYDGPWQFVFKTETASYLAHVLYDTINVYQYNRWIWLIVKVKPKDCYCVYDVFNDATEWWVLNVSGYTKVPGQKVTITHRTTRPKLERYLYVPTTDEIPYYSKIESALLPTADDVLHEFNSKLLAAQQPLGEEFERALFENLWDLYARP